MSHKHKEYRILQQTNKAGINTYSVEERERFEFYTFWDNVLRNFFGIIRPVRHKWTDWYVCREIQGDGTLKEYRNLIFYSFDKATDWLEKLRIKEERHRIEDAESEIVSTKEYY